MAFEHVKVNGMRIAYRAAGEGRSVVLLHGILADSRFWEPQLTGLSDEFRVIAWDSPGVGGSDDPPEDVGVEGYSALLEAFLTAVGANPATLVGLSWGGILALEFYRRYPGSVDSLVLTDTYAGWKGSLPPEEHQRRRAEALAQIESRSIPEEIPGVMHPHARLEAVRCHEEMLEDARPQGFAAMGRAVIDVDASDVLGSIDVPTLLLWGAADERAPMDVARAMLGAIPNARLETIPEAGHASSIEQPAAWNRALREFLLGS